MKIAVMGQGYVGLPLAMAAAKAGHNVIGFEPDQRRCTLLEEGHSYIEDVPHLTLMEALAGRHGIYKPTSNENDLKDFDVAVITVPTPLKKGAPDLSHVSTAVLMLSDFLKPGATVILESTVAPSTTQKVVVGMIERNTGWTVGEHFHVGFSPERIDPGNKQWHFGNTPKLISGVTPACAQKVELFYRSITEQVVLAATPEEAELAKVFENTHRQVNIALVNELQRMAHKLGVDVYRVIELCATKPFGFTPYTPGPGVGGHCLPVDPIYLTDHLRREHGTAFSLVERAQDINEGQPGYVARRLQDGLNNRRMSLKGARILALGQAYKPDTADMRESPAVEVVKILRAAGAKVTTVDPYFAENDIDQLIEIPEQHIGDYDAVVLLTPHSAFDLQHIATHANYVLDTRGVLDVAPNIERL